jgi:hypothetical protein
MTGGTITVEGCGSDSLQGDVRFAEVMGLMGAKVEWAPYSITITGEWTAQQGRGRGTPGGAARKEDRADRSHSHPLPPRPDRGTHSPPAGLRFCLALEPHLPPLPLRRRAAGPPRGQLKGVDHNCNDIPDAAMTAAVAALLADGPTAIRDVYNWRVKETERMKVGGSCWGWWCFGFWRGGGGGPGAAKG